MAATKAESAEWRNSILFNSVLFNSILVRSVDRREREKERPAVSGYRLCTAGIHHHIIRYSLRSTMIGSRWACWHCYECNERKIGDWKVTVACYLDLLVNHGRFFMFLFILFRARAEKYFFELRAVHLRAWHNTHVCSCWSSNVLGASAMFI
jgi:hypothetical protein